MKGQALTMLQTTSSACVDEETAPESQQPTLRSPPFYPGGMTRTRSPGEYRIVHDQRETAPNSRR